jgi:hypothetical protein
MRFSTLHSACSAPLLRFAVGSFLRAQRHFSAPLWLKAPPLPRIPSCRFPVNYRPTRRYPRGIQRTYDFPG